MPPNSHGDIIDRATLLTKSGIKVHILLYENGTIRLRWEKGRGVQWGVQTVSDQIIDLVPTQV